MHYIRCINNQGNEVSLTVGQVYKILPATPIEDDEGLIRVIDNEGEDYLYSQEQFEPIVFYDQPIDAITVHLDPAIKGILHAEALAAKKSVSALVRAWIDERLDLPERISA